MPRRTERIAPIPTDFFRKDAVRSTMHPVLIASMVLAYQYCEDIGSAGFLTHPQMCAAIGQISAHGFNIDSVIQDLLALSQLDDVGTGYQLPCCMAYKVRKMHADGQRNRYHAEHGNVPPNTLGARSQGAVPQPTFMVAVPPATQSDPNPTVSIPFPETEPGSGIRVRIEPVEGSKAEADSVPTSVSASASFHRSEKIYPPVPPLPEVQEVVGVGSPGGSEKGQKQRQTQAPSEPVAVDVASVPVSTAWVNYGTPEVMELVDELVTKMKSPVSRWEDADRGRAVHRREYAPPPWMLAEWVERMTLEQILEDLRRYRDKGTVDVTAVREHDSRFERFMQSSLHYKGKHMPKKLAMQKALREANRRASSMNRSTVTELPMRRAAPVTPVDTENDPVFKMPRPTSAYSAEVQRAERERLIAKFGEELVMGKKKVVNGTA